MSNLVVLGLCLILVAWLAAGSMAVRSASRIWLRHWAERRLRGAASVLGYLERPQRLLTAATGAIAVTLGLAGAWIGWQDAFAPGAALGTMGGYAALVVAFGFILPRAIARRWPSTIIPATIPVLNVAELLMAPLLSMGRAGGGPADPDASDDQPREAMQDLLREGELEGVGRHEEIAIISGVMEFGEKTVREVMTPKQDIFALPEDLSSRSVESQIAESAFSRVPIYRGSLDEIVGMYHAFDVLKEREEQLPPLRPVAYASEDTLCNELLFRMLRARMHLAVVHDAHGHTVGIVTLENLLEELVGDIRDEHDEPEGSSRPEPRRPTDDHTGSHPVVAKDVARA